VKRFLVAAFVLLIPVAAVAQERKTPVAVGHTGKDQVGMLFAEALNRELSHSVLYEPMKKNEKGFRFLCGPQFCVYHRHRVGKG
jgi:hypothetical protein